jgi:membrane-bound lytic murein transglycosylase MltF
MKRILCSKFDQNVNGIADTIFSMMKKSRFLLTVLFLVLAACNESATSDPEPAAIPSEPAPPTGTTVDAEAGSQEPASSRLTLEQIQQELGIPVISIPWSGDLDGMVERRLIRVLTVYGLGRYFVDGGRERGITYELFKMFEDDLNKRLGKKHIRTHVVFIPVARDELIPGLLEGRGDIAAAGLTITPERGELIDFSSPVTRELSEVLVTGPSAPQIDSIDDLAGRKIFVRASSSYRSSLDELNRRFRAEGLEEMEFHDVSEYLEDEDILEVVNSGALEWAVVDDYKARTWAGVFENLTIRDDIVFREGGRIAFAIRKDSPELMAALNEFVKSHRQGTLKGNILINRYVKDFDWTQNAVGAEDYRRFLEVIGIFEKYGDEYGFDYLIVAAQGYQESQLKQSARSHAGAVGIMQLLPSTAADPNVGIPDISKAEANIHAGVRYLNFIRNRYFSGPEMDDINRTLFALAAYNAGPARITRLRNKAEQQGYDPNRWFDNVEVLAAREIGRETVQYVANILKYYVVYRLSMIRHLQRQEDRSKIQNEE